MVLTLSFFYIGTLISLCLIVVFRIVIILSLPLFFIGSLYSCMWLMQIYRSARRARTTVPRARTAPTPGARPGAGRR